MISEKLNGFRPALLAAHGNNSPTADGASPSASGASTPAAYAPAPPAKEAAEKPKTAAVSEKKGGYAGSTSKVEVTAQLQASAEDIWGLLTDEKRIPMWSRSDAKVRQVNDSEA